jgi:hypothetical protein
MKPRELRGAINRAKAVYVYVFFDADEAPETSEGAEDAKAEEESEKGGTYLQVPKSAAKEICAAAEEDGITNITAEEDGRHVYIG